MEVDDQGCPIIRMAVSWGMFLLVPAYPCSPGQKAVKRLCVCVSVTGHISKEDGKLLCVCWSVSASTFELPDF